jgi:anthranilate synthase/aminodeoxychorismate synthase-like glutamine amidotransferase
LTERTSGARLAHVGATVAVIDNYDSFTYNLVQYLEQLGAHCEVRLNDATTPRELELLGPAGILLSPGPGTPDDAGVTLEVIRALGGSVPILGVCLGHQAIGQAYGGVVRRAPELMHGKTSAIYHQQAGVFRNLPQPFIATRYHSLIIERESLPACLEVTAETESHDIMGVRHRELPVQGVQFHPESILTDSGLELLKNWLEEL